MAGAVTTPTHLNQVPVGVLLLKVCPQDDAGDHRRRRPTRSPGHLPPSVKVVVGPACGAASERIYHRVAAEHGAFAMAFTGC